MTVAVRASWLELLLERVLCAIFILALLLNLGNAAARALFNVSLIWADEAQQFALVWLAFLGAALATVERAHIRMDLLRAQLPAPLQRAIEIAEAGVVPVVCGFALWHSASYLRQIAQLGARSDLGGVPMWLPHAAVTLGFALMAALEGCRLFRVMTRRSS